jgi:hypothetical protein
MPWGRWNRRHRDLTGSCPIVTLSGHLRLLDLVKRTRSLRAHGFRSVKQQRKKNPAACLSGFLSCRLCSLFAGMAGFRGMEQPPGRYRILDMAPKAHKKLTVSSRK